MDRPKPYIDNKLIQDYKSSIKSIICTSEVLKKRLELFISYYEQLSSNNPMISNQLNQVIHKMIHETDEVISIMNVIEHKKTKKRVIQFERMNLKILLTNLVRHYQDSHSKGVRVYELNYCAKDMIAVLNKSDIIQMIHTLIDHATKNTEEGLIIVEVDEKDDQWCFSVKYPKGIDSGDLSDLLKEKQENQPLCFEDLIESHKGQVKLTSIPDKRTEIKVFIPNDLPVGFFHIQK